MESAQNLQWSSHMAHTVCQSVSLYKFLVLVITLLLDMVQREELQKHLLHKTRLVLRFFVICLDS